ncbi:hypothetical protein ANN_08199 [Periplaneta americana]|uniref:Uncharacterized protein n=1 Tax=Periplaneta americana TaxID=6978 RepID=A0ABQ8T0R0_PERAM|nr:hypothetical protein ANN_08199 [Periplaneta americana]
MAGLCEGGNEPPSSLKAVKEERNYCFFQQDEATFYTYEMSLTRIHQMFTVREPLKLAIGIPLLQSLADFVRTISSLASVPGNVGDKVN